jgi:hypothetical protein
MGFRGGPAWARKGPSGGSAVRIPPRHTGSESQRTRPTLAVFERSAAGNGPGVKQYLCSAIHAIARVRGSCAASERVGCCQN